jgi:hypothetical protein
VKLIQPFLINDAALLSSSIGDGNGFEELSGDGIGELELSGDFSGGLALSGDMAGGDEWDAAALYAEGDEVLVTATDYHHRFESLSGGASHIVTMTIASPCVVTSPAHGLPAGTAITLTTTGALPTGLAVGTTYYVLAPATDSFNLAATVGGSAIGTTGAQSGTHTAIANPNLNQAPRDHPEFWLDRGASNRWAMFDQYNGSQSTAAELIQVEIATTGRANAVALLNVSAAEAQIISETDADGEVYNRTLPLISTTGITDWWSYFFEDIVRKGDVVVTDLPPYVAQRLTISLRGPGSEVAIGTLIIGRTKDIGVTVYGAGVGITDYSRKDVDEFGNYTIVPRAFSKRGTFKVKVEENRVDEIQRTLAQYRATPIVYLGTDAFESMQIFGFYRNFDQDLEGPNEAWCTLEIEGLT